MTPKEHEYYVGQCLELAAIALDRGDPPVGAVLVCDGEIIGRGIESGKSTGDITNHAEILAVRDAIAGGHDSLLIRSVMYTTHEPCIMCSYLIRHHKIPELVYGSSVPYVGGHTSAFDILATTSVPKWGDGPKVIAGVCVEECKALMERFAERLSR